jgi:hypothetical protein
MHYDVYEAHRGDQDDHGDDPRLEVVKVLYLEPAWQRHMRPAGSDLADEQFVQAEGGDDQGCADQEQVDLGQEDPELRSHR